MKIYEVNTRKELKEFVQFPFDLYKETKQFVPPLKIDELSTLTPSKNLAHEYCRSKLWIVKDNKKVIGRIAGIINKYENRKKTNEGLIARFGWVDFINNLEVARLLFKTFENWAFEEQVKVIHGPMGFTSFDKSGILINGFEFTPSSFSVYNYSYYATIIEQLGYVKEFDWVEYRINVPEKTPDKLVKGVKMVSNRYELNILQTNTLSDIKKCKNDIFRILNETYSELSGFTQLPQQQFNEVFNKFSQIIIPEFTAIVQNKNSEIIGFGVAIPSLSQALIKMRGKLFPFGLWHLKQAKRKNDSADLLLIAIKPEYQNKGAHALIFNKIIQAFQRNGIKYVESTKELEHNNQIQNLWQDYEYVQHRKSRCFIKRLK